MRALVAAVLLAVLSVGCSRQVEVRTSPDTSTNDVSVHLTNNLSQPVSVYAVSGGSELFLGQVAAHSAQHLSARGISSGSTVTLRARTADGTRTYARENVMISGTYSWQVP